LDTERHLGRKGKTLSKFFNRLLGLGEKKKEPRKVMCVFDFWDEIKIVLNGKIYLLDAKKLEKLLIDNKALIFIREYKDK
jgi:hypothetical protein